MKKITALLLVLVLNASLLLVDTNANDNDTFFVVTAYYSPLPNQEHYSYSVYTKRERTFQEEKRLQWQWIRWASWKKVFSWMLAAPANYKFWTKIHLEWLGVWEVADRWGAIVNKWVRWHSYDRVDVWMWYWDEWLKRATFWWKRTVKGKFLSSNEVVTLNYSKIPSPNWVIKSKAFKKIILNIFNRKLFKKEEFSELQKTLKELSYYNWAIDWKYESVRSAVYNFQLNKKIVSSKSSPWAGQYWPITRKALKTEFDNYLRKKESIKANIKKIELAKINIKNTASKKLNEIWKPVFWDISPSVRELQLTLKKLWYFKLKDTAIFWNITKTSIIKYQLDKWIIKTKNDVWAWYFGPKTRKSIHNDLYNHNLSELVKKENKIIKI